MAGNCSTSVLEQAQWSFPARGPCNLNCMPGALQSWLYEWGVCVQVMKGADVVQMIEKTKTDRFDKPLEDVKIVNIDIKMSVD